MPDEAPELARAPVGAGGTDVGRDLRNAVAVFVVGVGHAETDRTDQDSERLHIEQDGALSPSMTGRQRQRESGQQRSNPKSAHART